jgi:uncharacterized protein
MSLGLTSRFNILERSPYDLDPLKPEPAIAATPQKRGWTPSRYTLRAATADGGLVLWNTSSGKLSLFNARLASLVQAILKTHGASTEPEALVQFLAARGFIVPQGTDELRRFRFAFGEQHHAKDRLQLFLLASEDCNLRCTYCYEDFPRGTMSPWVRDAVKKYLAKRVPALSQFTLEWFGGEPLYGFEAIADIAPFACDLVERHNVRYLSKITTNAYLLTPEVFEQLLAWKVLSYQITVDGPAEHHDRSRPGRDGSPTFERIFSNLKAMHDRPGSFAVMLRMNFDRDNHHELGRLLDLVTTDLERDPRFRLSFRPVGQWGGPNDRALNVCAPDEAIDNQLLLEEEARKRGLLLAGSIHHSGGLGAQVCYASRPYSFIIGASGKVMKCTIDLDRRDRNVVGRIDEQGTLHLDQDKMAMWTEPAFESDPKCRKCVILPSCQGMSCPLERWDEHRSPCPSIRSTYKRHMRRAAAESRARQAGAESAAAGLPASSSHFPPQ